MDRQLEPKMGTMDDFHDSIKLLNKYRNFHYNAPLGTEENDLANAINDILPTFCKLIEDIDQRQADWIMDGSKHCHCTRCGFRRNTETQLGWRFCPVCGAEMDVRGGEVMVIPDKEIEDARKEGRLIILPRVTEQERQEFAENLHVVFLDWAQEDRSTSIFGMSAGEKALAQAIINGFATRQKGDQNE